MSGIKCSLLLGEFMYVRLGIYMTLIQKIRIDLGIYIILGFQGHILI